MNQPTRDSGPELVAEDNMCCGHKRCPVARIFDDGSVVLEDDDTGARISLDPEQADRVEALLALRHQRKAATP